jgi:hypothetical protein
MRSLIVWLLISCNLTMFVLGAGLFAVAPQ